MYEALHALTAAGLVRRIEPGRRPGPVRGTRRDNHHVVCRSCGVVADVDCTVGRVSCPTMSGGPGFPIDEAEAVHWGLCPGCSTARSS